MRKWRVEKREMLPTKGSKMTDVAVTDVTTETVAVTEVPTYADSNGDAVGVDSLVHVSLEVATGTYDYDNFTYREARDFDFGIVTGLNADGTVQVLWDAAGCACGDNENGRTEKTSDLTLSNDTEESLYHLAFDKGYVRGEKAAKENIRYALGLNSEDDE